MRRRKKPMKAIAKHLQRLRPAAAAKYLDIGESMLARMRVDGDGPRYIKLGARVFYDIRDLDTWIEANKYTSTSDYEAAR